MIDLMTQISTDGRDWSWFDGSQIINTPYTTPNIIGGYDVGTGSDYLSTLRAFIKTDDGYKEVKAVDRNVEPAVHKVAVEPTVPEVADVEVYNDCVVKVTFADGTFEKAVCSTGDVFNIDTGITICVLKKMMGADGHKRYNKMMRRIHKTIVERVIGRMAEAQKREVEREKAQKAQAKKQAKAKAAREEQVGVLVEALDAFFDRKGEHAEFLKQFFESVGVSAGSDESSAGQGDAE